MRVHRLTTIAANPCDAKGRLIVDEGQRSNNGHRPLKKLRQVTYFTLRLLLMCESLIN